MESANATADEAREKYEMRRAERASRMASCAELAVLWVAAAIR